MGEAWEPSKNNALSEIGERWTEEYWHICLLCLKSELTFAHSCGRKCEVNSIRLLSFSPVLLCCSRCVKLAKLSWNFA
jgi:hypothetical protein